MNILRLSSYKSIATKKEHLLMKAPFDDTYIIKLNKGKELSLKNNKNQIILSLSENGSASLKIKKGTILEIIAIPNNKEIDFDISLEKNNALLPFLPLKAPKISKQFNNNEDILKPALVKYKKRNKGIYINCNNPEVLKDSSLHKALSRVNIENEEVFFTFEHNNGTTKPIYYGYQVLNTSNENIYVTVKNVGFQLDGKGTWLGEKEWVDFYNLPFHIKNLDTLDESQKETYSLYFNFANDYKPNNYQPITYKIPPKKYIYVLGGTTKDAYNHINVFNMADKSVQGGCSNGVVLFDIKGKGEAIFYAYDDAKKIGIKNKTHQGYVVKLKNDDSSYGSQYVGYDDKCNGVVDANIVFEFNDKTKGQTLPVTFTNKYADSIENKKPYAKLKPVNHEHIATYWETHINPQDNHNAIGDDMTKYVTINSKGQKIIIDPYHLDGNGNVTNIGNWMVDYIDGYTFVNHGNNDRKITINMEHYGAIACFVRDNKLNVIEDTIQYAIQMKHATYQDKEIAPINLNFTYSVIIPAKSVIQFYVEYNLLANSSGNIKHEVILK